MPVKPKKTPTILIVDDEPFNIEFLEIVLKQQGYNIIKASNGRDGRAIAEEKQPDLILLDILMPVENGFECATMLRLFPETSDIPIIFLTALDDARNTTKGFDAGAVDFIIKPFNYADVIHRIRLHLKISACDRMTLKFAQVEQSEEVSQGPILLPTKGARATFTTSGDSLENYFYESVALSDSTEGHILLNISPLETGAYIQETARRLFIENTGPLFPSSETMRNIGVGLLNEFKGLEILGTYACVDRNTEKITVVNAGSNPAIFLSSNNPTRLIERHSGPLGSLGLGLLPSMTFSAKTGDRLFMFSKGLLKGFKTEGEGVTELKEACELSMGVDMETACQAVGEMLHRNGEIPDGTLVGIEV